MIDKIALWVRLWLPYIVDLLKIAMFGAILMSLVPPWKKMVQQQNEINKSIYHIKKELECIKNEEKYNDENVWGEPGFLHTSPCICEE